MSKALEALSVKTFFHCLLTLFALLACFFIVKRHLFMFL